MDGSKFRGQERPLTRRIEQLQERNRADDLEHSEQFFQVLRELEQGEWRLQQWARELGVSEDEMLIELDRLYIVAAQHKRRPPSKAGTVN